MSSYSGTITMDHTSELVNIAEDILGGEVYAIRYMRALINKY